MSPTIFSSLNSEKLVLLLKKGAIGVLPTDTIYGLSASAQNPDAIERLYALRNRDRSKPLIVLISSIRDLALFDIALDGSTAALLESIWPAPVSIVLPCSDAAYAYLHRGVGSIAFRMPAWDELRILLMRTGPLVTTSVNRPEGSPPAATIEEAQNYFGDSLDFIVDVGKREGQPSTLVRLEEGGFVVLRQGSYAVPLLTISGIK